MTESKMLQAMPAEIAAGVQAVGVVPPPAKQSDYLPNRKPTPIRRQTR